jgi:hypothetical protein
MLTDREMRDLSGKSCPHEEYEDYKREHAIATPAKPPPEGFLISPEAVERDMKKAHTKYVAENPETAGDSQYAYWFGYLRSAYFQLWHKYQEILHTHHQTNLDNIRATVSCTCQTPRNGD